MTDDLRAMSQEFARDPDSLVFLRLGEALRVRGQLDAASSVALAGLERYPELPEARDLYARILVDTDHPAQARQVWQSVLDMDPRHLGAHKGLGFLFFAEGDLDAALDHLETALSVDPTEASVVQALRVVRDTAEAVEEEGTGTAGAEVFAGLEGADRGLLLADTRGRALGGGLKDPSGSDVADEVAAYLGGVSQEADRTAKHLEFGVWQWLVVEAEGGNLHFTKPTDDTRLVVIRDRSVPPGRLSYLAAKANEAARTWLEAQRL